MEAAAAVAQIAGQEMGWTTEAAVRVLAYLGYMEEPLAPDIHDEFQRLYDQRPSHGHRGCYRTLLQCWQWLPHLYDSERDEMRKQLAELDEASKGEETQE